MFDPVRTATKLPREVMLLELSDGCSAFSLLVVRSNTAATSEDLCIQNVVRIGSGQTRMKEIFAKVAQSLSPKTHVFDEVIIAKINKGSMISFHVYPCLHDFVTDIIVISL